MKLNYHLVAVSLFDVSQKAITVAPGGAAVSVKMTTPQKAQTVITAGGAPVAKPASVPSTPMTSTTPAPTSTPAGRVTVVSQVELPYLFTEQLNIYVQ